MAEIDAKRVLRRLLDAAVRFEAKAAKHARIEAERNVLRDAITEAQLLLSVTGGKHKPPAKEPIPSAEDVRETGVLLRSVPRTNAMRAEQQRRPKKKNQ
jgi:hypothetical protein